MNDPNNYRTISLIDTICKFFVSILNTRLSSWSDENDITEESQAGFRKGYSTSDNIFILMTLVQKYLSKQNSSFYCIFIDYEKAFVKAKHNELWKALEKGSLNNIFQVSFNKVLSQQVTHERSYISYHSFKPEGYLLFVRRRGQF